MNFVWQEVRYSLRKLRTNPGFGLLVVLILGLGIGANTSIFSLVNAVLLRSLPYGNAGQLFLIYEHNPAAEKPREPVSPANYIDWAEQAKVFERLGASRSSTYTLTGSGEPVSVLGYRVSAGFFDLLQAPPLLGRTFQAEVEADGNPAVVLGYGFWQRRFGGEQGVLGRTITLDGKPYTVLGVMPKEFQYPTLDTELWTPLVMSPQIKAVRNTRLLRVVGRLKQGVTAEQARQEMSVVAGGLAQTYPDADAGWGVKVVPMHDEYVGDVRIYMVLLLGAAAFVLLIACTNITSLFLVRAAGRQREIAIRVSLGANRRRLVGAFLIEGAVLATLGGVVGLLLAWWGRETLISFFPGTISNLSIPRVASLPIDWRVLAFISLLCFVSTMVFGLLPAWQSSKPELNAFLKEGSRGTTAGFGGRRFRNVLIVGEIALAFVLMIGAGLMIKSFREVRQSNLGFDPHQLLTARVQLPPYKYKEAHQRAAFYAQTLQRIGALPGVQSVGFSNYLPLSGWWNSLPFVIEGRPAAPSRQEPEVDHRVISPHYFAALKVPLVKGRYFTDADDAQATQVVIINESMARRYWPGEDPLGRRIKFAGEGADDWRAVVGVVGDIRHFGAEVDPKPEVYRPYLQESSPLMGLAIRTTVEPTTLARAVRGAIHEVDADQPVSHLMTMNDLISESAAPRQVSMTLLTILGSAALLLAALGIYGVLSYSIVQRRHEIGIRMALGAQRGQVIRLIMRQSLKLILIGITTGLALGLLLTQVFSTVLFGVRATDPETYAGVTLTLALTAFVASYIPARRATRVEPLIALRNE
ncbi:MAG TPA: ABC transporter permease [Pyrinomonadaceae bacterium]|jgi:putative ABC transport system permease protein